MFTISSIDWTGVGLFAIKALGLYGVLSLIQLALRGRDIVRRSAVILNLTFLFFSLYICLPQGNGDFPDVRNALMAGFLFFSLCLLIKAVDVLFFDLIFKWRGKKPIPVVVRDILRWVITGTVLFSVIHILYPSANLNVLALSSIVVGYIVGNATQETLGNLISGLALNTERPFEIGDWVTIGGHTGMVVDMTWRATRLRTKTEDYIIIPNSTISREPISNYSRPTTTHGRTCVIGVSYDAPPNKVRAAILSALAAVPRILKEPEPCVLLTSYGDSSINYTVKYFISDFQQEEPIGGEFMNLIWYHFKREGIQIPYPIRDVRLTTKTAADEAAEQGRITADNLRRLRAIDLFAELPEAELSGLAGQISCRLFAAGEILVKQGETGDSFFVIREGSVSVSVEDEGGHSTVVAMLGEGSFFGEMCLLTGEKRSATITASTDTTVLVLSRESMAGMMARNESLAVLLAAVLERRTKDSQSKVELTRDARSQAGGKPAEGLMLNRIRAFFRLPAR